MAFELKLMKKIMFKSGLFAEFISSEKGKFTN